MSGVVAGEPARRHVLDRDPDHAVEARGESVDPLLQRRGPRRGGRQWLQRGARTGWQQKQREQGEAGERQAHGLTKPFTLPWSSRWASRANDRGGPKLPRQRSNLVS